MLSKAPNSETIDIEMGSSLQLCDPAHYEYNNVRSMVVTTDSTTSSSTNETVSFDDSKDDIVRDIQMLDKAPKSHPDGECHIKEDNYNQKNKQNSETTTDSATSSQATRLQKKARIKGISESVRGLSRKAHTKLFGDDYSKKEGAFVIVAGALIAFNNGYVNGSCLSGLINPTGIGQSVAGFTSAYTDSALAVAQGRFDDLYFESRIILSYMFGAFLSGMLTPNATPYRIEPTYGPTFIIGGLFLLISSILAALEYHEQYIFFFAAAANGIQNGIASIYSANLIRCSLTGSSTDIALVVGQLVRGNRQKLWKGLVLSMIVISFWFGGLVSFYATMRFRTYSLFFNATIFWIIGGLLVYFLVHELRISVRAAVLGSWEWKIALNKLHKRMIFSLHGDATLAGDTGAISLDNAGPQEFDTLFNRIDKHGKGRIEEADLYIALERAGAKADGTAVKTLMKSAADGGNVDGESSISREKWKKICYACQSSSRSSGNLSSISE